MRALFFASYPHSCASTRFRATQYFPYLHREGIECHLSPFLPERVFRKFYSGKGIVRKGLQLSLLSFKRVFDALRAGRYDVVVVQREAMLMGPAITEWLTAHIARVPVVFDFDDAIWMQQPGSTWGAWSAHLKFPGKTAQIIRMADHVIGCNSYTRDYALQFRRPEDVTVIPTVVDAQQFKPDTDYAAKKELTVGWIGTHSTAKYLEEIAEPLRACAREFPFTLKLVGAGRDLNFDGVQVHNKTWKLNEEVADYQSLDIGLYPVKDDAWGKGKTGFKPVVYMACGVPCICAPVGGVTEFLQHNQNGLLASTPAEWQAALSSLLRDRDLRERLGRAGRHTVESEYSLQVQAPRLAQVLRQAAQR